MKSSITEMKLMSAESTKHFMDYYKVKGTIVGNAKRKVWDASEKKLEDALRYAKEQMHGFVSETITDQHGHNETTVTLYDK